MDKIELRNIINSLKEDDEITVRFIGDRASMDGDYRVSRVRTGPGKGGSRLANLVSKDVNDKGLHRACVIGTPKAHEVLSLEVGGVFHGFKSVTDAPPTAAPSLEKHRMLKGEFINFGTGDSIRIDATMPEYTGDFIVEASRKQAGRYGQMILTVCAPDGTRKDIWSYRHSGLINTITKL